MRPFDGRRILLGVTGGIASYKSAWLARLLTQAGAQVDVVLTRSAREFIGSVTFEALTGRPVHTVLIGDGHALDHIRLAREAELIVIAPATADFLARAAHGHADELLSATLLAAECPVLLVPAMNDKMWANATVRANCAALAAQGKHILDPGVGPLASPDEGAGQGRMQEPETIVAHSARLLEPRGKLAGKRIVVTAGPTREPLDPVRYLTNHSTGKQGIALAEAAWRRGAAVVLVHGPLSAPAPVGAVLKPVETTQDMAEAVASEVGDADVLIMAAAPADFRPAQVASAKMKKTGTAPTLALEETPDILKSTAGHRKAGMIAVGFALETDDVAENAQKKLAAKQLTMIVANSAREAGAGFGHDTNRVTIFAANGTAEEFPLLSKRETADAILDRIEAML
ncbi:bifunctional phosphopantothenoylcysteine decarboxylase/phosphopantothenate--cysteine ligase CoaBC [Pseudogemmatithrix spongiicola]|uniref:Coenzyme A biosynthesis bifunctional protein CoaBC n=1 Tax=Pseudogemmatithrix spongiicola TaxID=3062599 RepID=A0AA49Q7X0_9BACT|nr:bifunctional phosphopantothenoylcysteine decarboxylase/phosphopantothenate--cysteine ligase CoaBC [Gemmatimonadaceae bacterium 'strain 138']WKW15164.1 bifunctional phosphopantothenoylcysteine decarboxylase/phosphopantothenate--cysteine ligase CoaBC [Gemmatimonadaceae bacterium 'strain 318']